MRHLNFIGFFLLSIIALSCLSDENATPLNVNTFIRVYSDSETNLPHSVIELEDGFVCLATATRTSTDGDIISKIKLVRTTANGSPIWTKSFPAEDSLGNYRAAGLVYDDTKIIVLADSLSNNNLPSKPFLFEVDLSGGLISKKVITAALLNGNSFAGKAINLSENNNLMVGLDVIPQTTAEITQDDFSMAILTLDINNDYEALSETAVGKGAIYRMSKSIFEYQGAVFFAATQSNEGQMSAWKMIGNDPTPIPINLQGQGSALVNQIQFYKQSGNQAGFAVIGTFTNNNNNEEVVFAQLNQDVQIIGEEKILESQQQNNRRGISIAVTPDNGFILGETTINGPSNSITLTKIDGAGQMVWEQVFDRSSNGLIQVISTQDDRILVLGTTLIGSSQSILLYKVDSSGEFTTN